MRSSVKRLLLAGVLASALPALAVRAEGEAKALPTLVIKGEVVSVDSSDPSAVLLKVKDRYGFETPIYLKADTKIAQGDSPIAVSNLTSGNEVEVEYNFDVNTAKRHAVSVKLKPAAAPSEPAASAPAEAPAAAPAAEQPAASTPAAAPVATEQPAPAAAPQSQGATPASSAQ